MAFKRKIKDLIKKNAHLVALLQMGYGIATTINPRLYRSGTGGTKESRYCYSVWMRHFVTMCENGMSPEVKSIAELGPGDSIGIGLAAVLSGADIYYALDIVPHSDIKTNLQIFDELTELFKNRTPIPDDNEFPKVGPKLQSYVFPTQFLSEKLLERALDQNRIEQIRRVIKGDSTNSTTGNRRNEPVIRYVVPWTNDKLVSDLTACDVILSQAVLEHIDDLKITYHYMYKWLTPTGYMSHEIDFKSHGTSACWNGHWGYSKNMWKLIRGKRPYLLNREPLSTHLGFLHSNKFNILKCDTARNESYLIIKKSELKEPFINMSDQDFTTQSVYILAQKQ